LFFFFFCFLSSFGFLSSFTYNPKKLLVSQFLSLENNKKVLLIWCNFATINTLKFYSFRSSYQKTTLMIWKEGFRSWHLTPIIVETQLTFT
jgi:hypothetical protein